MEDSVFNLVLSKAKEDYDFCSNLIGFNCELGSYGISFYSIEDFKEIKIEDFGYFHKGEWVQMKPTKMQILKMFELINLEKQSYYLQKDALDEERKE